MKFIKNVLLLILFLISNANIIFASSNLLINDTNNKELEINEKYNKKLNININNIKIENIGNNKIEITGNIDYIQNFNSDNIIAVPYNIKKSSNEIYNLNDVYIMAFSSIKSNINVYWQRKIFNDTNIGKGYIKDDENVIIEREYGTGDDKTIQNEEIYTNNSLIKKITETNYFNDINIDNNDNNIIFKIIIDRNRVSKMRYLYICKNINIIVNNDLITYDNLISDSIDLLNYCDDNILNLSSDNENKIKEQPTLFGATPVTSNFTIYKAAEALLKHYYAHGVGGSGGESRNNFFTYSKNNGFYISDSNQNKATASVCDIKMKQDDEYYYFDVNIDYKSDVPYNTATNIGNNEYQSINSGTLYLANEEINNLSYNYTITYPISSVYSQMGWQAYMRAYYSSGNYSSNNYYDSELVRKDSLTMNINGCSATQAMNFKQGGEYKDLTSDYKNSLYTTYTPTNSADGFNNPALKYCSYTFPFETYLYGNSNHTPLTNFGNKGVYEMNYNGNAMSNLLNSKIDAIIKNKILYNNGQQNFTMPQKPNYTTIENVVSTNNSIDSNWNNNIKAKIIIKKSDINNYRYLNMYAPNGVIKSKTNSYWTYTESESSLNNSNGSYTWNSPEAKQVAYSIHSKNAIDLLPYSICEHNWVLGDIIDENQHYIYCSKCEWHHKINHNYEYEYDGMTNNLCACGFNHDVKHTYKFNSNLINDYEEIVLASSSYVKNNNPLKTGYKFKYFDKYLKYFDNMINPVFDVASTSIVNTYIGQVASMSEISDRFSTTYIANYDPIKYYVHFNSNNNMNLPVNTNEISDMPCYYDEEYVPPIISYTGYTFKGWTIASGSNIVNISKHGRIKNLTSIENEIVDVYPVFDIFTYKFSFSTQSNINKITITENISDLVCEKDIHYNLPNNISVTGYNFKGWSLTKYSDNIDFNPNEELFNYTSIEDQEYTIYPIYEPIKYTFKFSNNNLKNILLNNSISDETFTYNEPKNLPDNILAQGFGFKGWSLVATSSNIDFEQKAEILNYTSTHNKEYILYPVYDELKFSIIYMTVDGKYSNNNSIIKKDYSIENNYNLEIPSITAKTTYNKLGKVISNYVAEFINYTDENNKEFKTFNDIKEFIYNKGIYNYTLYLNYNYRLKNTIESSGSGSDSSGITNGTTVNNEIPPILDNKIEIKEITIRANNKNIKTIKKDVKISKKDLVDFINEIYNDFKDQNNIQNQDIVIYINDTPYNNQYDIISLINEVYNDFIDNLDINIVKVDKKEGNNQKDGMVYSFTSTEITTKSNVKNKKNISTISNTNKSISTNSNITKRKSSKTENANVATKSTIKSNKFINKIFKDTNDIKNIEEIIEICNNREFMQLYKNLSENKYRSTISDFFEKYDGLIDKIEIEIKKPKYNNLNRKIIEIINDEEFVDLKKELVEFSYKNNKDYINFINDIKSKRVKKLIYNIYNGKYKTIINGILPIITNEKYIKRLEYELIDGECSDTAYDLIYYIFETTYNYKIPEKETIIREIETTTIVKATISEIKIEKKTEENELPIVSLIAFIAGIILVITIVILVLKKISKKDEM